MASNADEQFFKDHKDRQCHIRPARDGEKAAEFRTLGLHDASRRMMLLWKVPKDNPLAAGQILRIPFLKFSSEEIRDEDDALLYILNEIMNDAAESYGIRPPRPANA